MASHRPALRAVDQRRDPDLAVRAARLDALSLGEWVLSLAGLVWLAAYLALLAGRPHAGGPAAVGVTQVAVLRVQHMLLTHAPIEAAAAAAASVVVPALLLLGLAAYHRDAPLPPRRPWC